MESGRRLKQREKEGTKSRSNGGRESKGKIQNRSKTIKASKCVSAKNNSWGRRERKQFEETRAESTAEPEVMGRTTEVRTGRGSAGLVRGGDERCRADETNRKGKGKGNGGKGEHEGKGGGFGHKGKQQETRERKEEQVRMAPNMEAGGSHPQAMSDPGEGEMAEGERQRNEEKEEILKLLRGWQERETSPIVRWAWVDESTEEESNQEEVREEKPEKKRKKLEG